MGKIHLPPEKVYVLYIEHKNGTDFWVYRDKDGPHARLYEWVKEWWDIEVKQYEPRRELPDNEANAIEEYFDFTDRESYAIGETDLL